MWRRLINKSNIFFISSIQFGPMYFIHLLILHKKQTFTKSPCNLQLQVDLIGTIAATKLNTWVAKTVRFAFQQFCFDHRGFSNLLKYIFRSSGNKIYKSRLAVNGQSTSSHIFMNEIGNEKQSTHSIKLQHSNNLRIMYYLLSDYQIIDGIKTFIISGNLLKNIISNFIWILFVRFVFKANMFNR